MIKPLPEHDEYCITEDGAVFGKYGKSSLGMSIDADTVKWRLPKTVKPDGTWCIV